MKQIIICVLLLTSGLNLLGQKYFTQNGTISFFSEATLENIESTNDQVSSVIDLDNGNMAFSLLMKAFVFEKALMQTHFNEKYIESEIYPKSTFKGEIKNLESLQITEEPQEFTVVGKLTIHGVTKEISTKATIHFDKMKKLLASSEFEILLSDYNIKIPSSVKENISNEISIKIQMEYEEMD